ncbi:MAG: tryptophan--tRNA ligase [Acidimicrobiaceae bacterium]|nr:tryptophan--tRNA ligase [Acidimicrobiaceae bacterium]|tara:strand:+ start:109 stop:1107 length:999 start_codon:yes stop_codon:yes gene_type:complete
MTRVLSGIQPTGDIHLGNFLGALRQWAIDQHEHDSFYCAVDLHAITVQQDPVELRSKTLETMATLVAVGLDPEVCTLFVQSHVPFHTELSWLLECTVSFGELRRMTQFKDKSVKQGDAGQEHVSAGLFTYPALMAADILIYDADRVPVGDDQRQHLELTRDVAERFNSRYGETFTLPAAAIQKIAARVMDLQEPTNKMSKSSESPMGTVGIFEDTTSIAKKLKRAVTDSENEVRFDFDTKPGVSNLLSILGAATGRNPETLADEYHQYGPLKNDTAEAIINVLEPVQRRRAELLADPAELDRIIARGAGKASEVAAVTVQRAKDAMGFLPSS